MVSRIPHCLRRLACGLATCAVIGLPAPAVSAADDALITIALPGASYGEAREALLDAIAAEGLTTPTISAFSAMLDRTAAALGHPQGLYAEAEVFTFCSARIAAVLVQESPANIARCPLSIALHANPGTPPTVHLGYRRPDIDSPGGRLAHALLARIAASTQAEVGTR